MIDRKKFRAVVLKKLEDTSVAALSRKAGVGYDVIREIKRRPDGQTTIENAQAIAAAFGQSLDEFVASEPPPRCLEIQEIFEKLSPNFQKALMQRAWMYLEVQKDLERQDTDD